MIEIKFTGETMQELSHVINATKNEEAVERMWDELFRPRHKHGYGCSKIDKLMQNECCDQLMDLLEERFKNMFN